MPNPNASTLLRPAWGGPCMLFHHAWAPVWNIGRFRWLARTDAQKHLVPAREELGARHVRNVAMFSPELVVWEHDLTRWGLTAEERSNQANRQMIDLCLEPIPGPGLKPIYNTCFTPAGMTDDPMVCWSDNNPTGLPRDPAQGSSPVAPKAAAPTSRWNARA